MQIHELNTFSGTPGTGDYFAIDNGSTTSKINATGLLNLFYPVGSFYETSDASFNPNAAWGGTWVRETEGLVHIGSGRNYTAGSTGGEKTVTLTTSQIPAHTHGSKSLVGAFEARRCGTNGGTDIIATVSGIVSRAQDGASVAATVNVSSGTAYNRDKITITATHEHSSVGGGGSHNNMQPYVVVNRWHRTA